MLSDLTIQTPQIENQNQNQNQYTLYAKLIMSDPNIRITSKKKAEKLFKHIAQSDPIFILIKIHSLFKNHARVYS